jgi:3-oxoadipate enol-lactonase
VLAPDLPGHGGAAGPFTLRAAVASVVAAIDSAGGTAHLAGISGGAVVALLTCLDHPDRVSSLALSAGVAHPPRWFGLQRAMVRMMPEPLLVRLLRGQLSGGRAEHARAAEDDVRRCGKRTFRAGLRAIAGIDLRPRLHRVAVPALVLCGSADRANIAPSRELAAGISGAELRIVDGANHLWSLQQPEAFNRILGGFVERAATARRDDAER